VGTQASWRKNNAYYVHSTHDPSSLALQPTTVHNTYLLSRLGFILGSYAPHPYSWSSSLRSESFILVCTIRYFTTMSDDQISLPYLLAILVVSGLVIRYMFFAGPSPPRPARSPEAFLRSREIAVDRIQQMFPQADRRSILWDLQRNGGNIQTTTERILSGRLDTVCRNSLCLMKILEKDPLLIV